MGTLVVYYSRTNITKLLAMDIQKELNCKIEDIIDKKDRSGSLNYFLSALDALRKKPANIEPTLKDPSDFHLTIIATPVWAGTMSTPILTYIKENRDKFNNVAFIATCGSSEGNTFKDMAKILNKGPVKTMVVTSKDTDGQIDEKINSFVQNLK
ncbi:flavodoxin family protein [Methanobrevibacter sp. DSM 116169]|uniref:flavodoxin family protein n=1 Tax=Methanobrevibacter sp. DSM 116169 TaxID=3242727 RepID=UPI0038FD0923